MATVHVLPVGDLVEHDDEGDGCPCGVTVEPVKDEATGAVGWLITHHSLDGREQYEGGPMPVKVLDPNCPTCRTGPGRSTTDMVCQACGTDYAPDAREVSDGVKRNDC